jgi:hypothetical protein
LSGTIRERDDEINRLPGPDVQARIEDVAARGDRGGDRPRGCRTASDPRQRIAAWGHVREAEAPFRVQLSSRAAGVERTTSPLRQEELQVRHVGWRCAAIEDHTTGHGDAVLERDRDLLIATVDDHVGLTPDAPQFRIAQISIRAPGPGR